MTAFHLDVHQHCVVWSSIVLFCVVIKVIEVKSSVV